MLLLVAVKVTGDPEQMDGVGVEIVTSGVTSGITFDTSLFDVAELVDRHDALLVITHSIVSPCVGLA